MLKQDRPNRGYETGFYWRQRSDLLYYRYLDYIMRVVCKEATSVADVGTGGCPYLEWFDWIPEKLSVDIAKPYSSSNVKGLQGNILELEFPQKYDVCTCLQVLEHIHEAKSFARRLYDIGKMVIVSVPYKWPAGSTKGHVHDPVDYNKLTQWMGRDANYKIIVEEPFRNSKRLIAIYDEDESRVFGQELVKNRLIR